MRFASTVFSFLLFTMLGGCAAMPTSPPNLGGTWTVIAGEHAGQPMNGIAGGMLTVMGDEFSIRTTSGNQLQGRLETRASKTHHEIDFLHANGARWVGIYTVEGDRLMLNYIDVAQQEPRPTQFSTAPETEASLLTLQRANDLKAT